MLNSFTKSRGPKPLLSPPSQPAEEEEEDGGDSPQSIRERKQRQQQESKRGVKRPLPSDTNTNTNSAADDAEDASSGSGSGSGSTEIVDEKIKRTTNRMSLIYESKREKKIDVDKDFSNQQVPALHEIDAEKRVYMLPTVSKSKKYPLYFTTTRLAPPIGTGHLKPLPNKVPIDLKTGKIKLTDWSDNVPAGGYRELTFSIFGRIKRVPEVDTFDNLKGEIQLVDLDTLDPKRFPAGTAHKQTVAGLEIDNKIESEIEEKSKFWDGIRTPPTASARKKAKANNGAAVGDEDKWVIPPIAHRRMFFAGCAKNKEEYPKEEYLPEKLVTEPEWAHIERWPMSLSFGITVEDDKPGCMCVDLTGNEPVLINPLTDIKIGNAVELIITVRYGSFKPKEPTHRLKAIATYIGILDHDESTGNLRTTMNTYIPSSLLKFRSKHTEDATATATTTPITTPVTTASSSSSSAPSSLSSSSSSAPSSSTSSSSSSTSSSSSSSSSTSSTSSSTMVPATPVPATAQAASSVSTNVASGDSGSKGKVVDPKEKKPVSNWSKMSLGAHAAPLTTSTTPLVPK